MAKRKTRHPQPQAPASARPSSPADRVSAAFAALGLLITAYLGWIALTGEPAALCSAGSSCELIQQSHWSRLFGVPVALYGLATYALLLLAALLPSPKIKRWRRLWTLSLIGVAVSAYLTAAGLISMQAVCGWCLASLVLITSLFARAQLARPSQAPGMSWSRWWLQHGALLLLLLGVMQLSYSGLLAPRADPRLQALAEHLGKVDAKFYGTFWCPNCQQQKALFGGAADALPYVECSPNGRNGGIAFACTSAEIRNFPTWIIYERRIEGVIEAEILARHAGFDWDGFRADDS